MDKKWINEFCDKIEKKLNIIAPQVETEIPYTTDENGKYIETTTPAGVQWWTNGFWAGLMWLAYLRSGNEAYKSIAEASEKRLDDAFVLFNGLHHDVGFMWLLSAVAHYRIDGNEASKTRGMHAATLLAGRFNHDAEFIRAWNRDKTGWSIIDSMMNLPILYWASEEMGNCSRSPCATSGRARSRTGSIPA